jgi:hypothetical protein
MLTILAPALTFHFFATLIVVIAAVCIVLWMLQKAPIAPPLNYVVYALVALLALWFVFTFLGG